MRPGASGSLTGATPLARHRRDVQTPADGAWLASAGFGPDIEITDPATGQLLRVLDSGSHFVTALALPGSGAWLASGGVDRKIRIWDPGTGKVLQELVQDGEVCRTMTSSPDGTWLVTVVYRSAHVWDIRSGRLHHTPAGHERSLNHVAVSPDNRLLAAAGDDRALRIWDIASGENLCSIRINVHPTQVLWTAPESFLVAGDSSPRLFTLRHAEDRPSGKASGV